MQFLFQLQTLCQMAAGGDRSHSQLQKPANPSASRNHRTVRPRTFQVSSGDRRRNLESPTQPHPPPQQRTKAQPSLRLVPH